MIAIIAIIAVQVLSEAKFYMLGHSNIANHVGKRVDEGIDVMRGTICSPLRSPKPAKVSGESIADSYVIRPQFCPLAEIIETKGLS